MRAVGTVPPGVSGPEMRWWRSRVLMECPCGVLFTHPLSEVRKSARKGTRVYCSLVCATAGQAVTQCGHACKECGAPVPARRAYCSQACKTAAAARFRLLRELACPECGAPFRPKTSRTVYCSRECANRAHSRRMRGLGNSHHTPARSDAAGFARLRPLVVQRDGGCVICLSTTDLVVHHRDEDPSHNTLANLVTLCRRCHARLHKTSGTVSHP